MAKRQVKSRKVATRKVVKPMVPHALAVPPKTMAMMKARFETAGHALQVTGRASGRFARSSMREMTGAIEASREPMLMLWRNVRLASRHIAREAVDAWQEVALAHKPLLKLPVVPPVRRAAA